MQHPGQALAEPDAAFGQQWAELWPGDLVFQTLMVSFLMIMKNELRCDPMEARRSNQTHSIQAGLFVTPHKTPGESIQIRGTHGQSKRFDAPIFEDHPEVLAEQAGR